jgi:hypothetical protein
MTSPTRYPQELREDVWCQVPGCVCRCVRSIALGLARDESFAPIARRLGRPTSTVSREVGFTGGCVSNEKMMRCLCPWS